MYNDILQKKIKIIWLFIYLQCRGFWYNYPDLPTGPSRDMDFMAFKEARFTKIYEFYNNVAHSNKGVSTK